MTNIDKKDTHDLANSIAIKLMNMISAGDLVVGPVNAKMEVQWTKEIQEELNNWIGECETEDAIETQRIVDNLPGTGEMF